MSQEHLFAKVHQKFEEILAEYLDIPPIEEYIIPTGLGNQSGILGGLLLAQNAYEESQQ